MNRAELVYIVAALVSWGKSPAEAVQRAEDILDEIFKRGYELPAQKESWPQKP